MQFNRYNAPLTRFLRTGGSALFAAVCALFLVTNAAAQTKTILFVYNPGQNDGVTNENGTIDDEDAVYLDIIQDQLGYEVQLIDEALVQRADTIGVDGIFISESAGSGNARRLAIENNAFADIHLPIINAEALAFDDFYWTVGGPATRVDSTIGFAVSEYINIADIDHAILGGLREGPVDVYDEPNEPVGPNQVGYGIPTPGATILAYLPGTALLNGQLLTSTTGDRSALFAFDTGDVVYSSDTLDIVAPARRVAIYPHRNGSDNPNDVGRRLIRNAIAWAMGDEALLTEIQAPAYQVLFVYNPAENDGVINANGAIDNEDAAYVAMFEDMGYEVQFIDHALVQRADTIGVDAVFIAESAGSGNAARLVRENGAFADIGLPIISAEALAYDDFYWVELPARIDSVIGFVDSDSVLIVNTTHPISNGLMAKPYDVYGVSLDLGGDGAGINQIGFGIPNAEAVIVAEVPETARHHGATMMEGDYRSTIFTYDWGTTVYTSDSLEIVAPDRRVAIFPHRRGSDNLNQTGHDLILNSLLWATGRDAEVVEVRSGPLAAPGEKGVANRLAIGRVSPNPFSARATATVDIREAGAYELRVYDVLGRVVYQSGLGKLAAGSQAVSVDLSGKSSGVYLIQVRNLDSDQVASTKATLVR